MRRHHAPLSHARDALADITRTIDAAACRLARAPVQVGDPNLTFVESPALKPPEVQIDQTTQQQYELELQNAQNMPLPDEDEDL